MTVTATDAATDERRVGDLVDELLREYPPASTEAKVFLGAQFDKGLGWVHFEEGCGGLGLNPRLQRLVNERVFAAGPVPGRVGAEGVVERPDAEIGVVEEQRVSRSALYLCQGNRGPERCQQETDDALHD